MLTLAIICLVVSCILLVVSGLLFLSTVGIRRTITVDLMEQATEVGRFKESLSMVGEQYKHVMESFQQIDSSHRQMREGVASAINQQTGMLRSELSRIADPDDQTRVN